jgi:hypothetical protein
VLVGTSQVVPATARGGSRGPRPDQATSFLRRRKSGTGSCTSERVWCWCGRDGGREIYRQVVAVSSVTGLDG